MSVCRHLIFTVAALVILAAPVPARTILQGADGDAFYIPPPLPAAPLGTPIWTRPLEGTMALPSAARNILAAYRSVDDTGRAVAVSGAISIPQGTAPKGGWPVITWTHGTTGLNAI